jgi:CheY-like chemotaxis protein
MACILVADDEPAVRQLVRMVCEKAGHRVHDALSAPTAVETYQRVKPDLLVLDLDMPGGGGPFVLSSLRFGGVHKIAPVLVITGNIERSPDEIRSRLSVDRVLPKPFRAPDLLHAVQDLLQRGKNPMAPPQAS